ncbi:hypothetical protein [Rhodobacter sp. NSM]|uniref:hypothetical protein n=1 Tax=Rhodobacter sp. NSM TaxID=3457501 RepID=UPI003FD39730
MEPARTIITKLGGPSKVAEIVGIHRTRVYSWMRPRIKGGTGGLIPMWHVPALMAAAAEAGVHIAAADFVPAAEPCETSQNKGAA